MGQRLSLSQQLIENAGQPDKAALPDMSLTNAASKTLASAATGKADGTSTATTASPGLAEGIQANLAQQTSRSTQAEAQVASMAAGQKEAAQKQEFQQQTVELNEQRLNAEQEYIREASRIASDLGRKGQQLDLRKDGAKLEQLGFYARLSDKKYADTLELEGRRRRLDNASNFKQALAEAVFKDERELFMNDLAFKRMMSADDREFQRLLANISLEDAIELSMAQAAQENIAAKWSGVAGIAGATAQGGALVANNWDSLTGGPKHSTVAQPTAPKASTPLTPPDGDWYK